MTRPLYQQVLALTLPLPKWWDDLENSTEFQTYSNYGLCAAYVTISLVALVQLGRIQYRVPEYGWTTQKVFHLLNGLVSGMRAAIFFFRPKLDDSSYPTYVPLLLKDLPGLLFFTTYTLLVLFWAEIYHQARSMPSGALRPVFLGLNVSIYIIQGALWGLSLYSFPPDLAILTRVGIIGSSAFLAVVYLGAALGFLLYGGRLFLMLQRFPIESRGRRKKLREVGLVTTICAGCFTLRAFMIASAAWDGSQFELDRVDHPLPNVLYYCLVEIIPSACVLYILRKLPPNQRTQQGYGYQQIPSQ